MAFKTLYVFFLGFVAFSLAENVYEFKCKENAISMLEGCAKANACNLTVSDKTTVHITCPNPLPSLCFNYCTQVAPLTRSTSTTMSSTTPVTRKGETTTNESGKTTTSSALPSFINNAFLCFIPILFSLIL